MALWPRVLMVTPIQGLEQGGHESTTRPPT